MSSVAMVEFRMDSTDRMNFVFQARNKIAATISNDHGLMTTVCDRPRPKDTRIPIIWSIITDFLDPRGTRHKPNPNPLTAEEDT
jgi:hypothetical protein